VRDEKQFISEEQGAFEDGFNIKSLLGALFTGVVMLPAAIYLTLMTGSSLVGAAEWVTIILFVEIAKRAFIKLKKQEIYILHIIATGIIAGGATIGAAGLVLGGGPFSTAIWNQYLVQSPQAEAFGLTQYIPQWIVPPVGSEALLERTFFHRDWLTPIAILVIHQILFTICGFCLGYILYRLTNDVERLQFPMAPVAAEGATALAEASAKTEGWRWQVFSIGSMIGILFGSIYVVVPAITGLMAAVPIQLIPIPFIDKTAEIGTILPGSLFGTMTDLGVVIIGFVLPFWVVLGTFVSSILVNFVGNPILYRFGMLPTWSEGLTVVPASMATNIDFWISIGIGIAIAVALIGFWSVGKAFAERRQPLPEKGTKDIPKGRGDFPIVLMFALWFLATVAYIILMRILIPQFPSWIVAVLGFVLTPILSYITARMFGITGVASGVSFPFVRESSFVLFGGGAGPAIWFAPVPYADFGAHAQGFKQLELTRTKFISWAKAIAIVLVVSLTSSFIFWSLIWRIGPIPSATYPFAQRMWPLFSTMQVLWASITLGEGGSSYMLDAISRPTFIFAGGIGTILIYNLILILKIPVGFFYGFVGGVLTWPHLALPMMIGGIFSKFYLEKRFGVKLWRQYAPVLFAGYLCGVGLVGIISIGIALITRSVAQLIF
jgi:hypothetical protein